MTDTVVSIDRDRFLVNGKPTHEGRTWKGHAIEGLLFNSRMANAIADDSNPSTRGVWAYPDGPWDPERNTNEFCAALADYRQHGLDAVCLNLQGGNPVGYTKYQPWIISGYTEDGALKPDWAARLARVIAAADAQRMVIVLGLFYGWSSRHLRDEAAVRRAVKETVDWLAERRVRNVLVEIGNEVDHVYYSHRIIEAPRCHELIQLAQEQSKGRFETPAGRLLVGTSLLHPKAIPENIASVSDFLIPHGNWIYGPGGQDQSSPDGVRLQLLRIRSAPGYRGQPIFYNEDDHFDFEKPDNHLRAAVEGFAGWGYFDLRLSREGHENGFQGFPIDWQIRSPRKRGFFGMLKEITGQ